LLIATSTSHLLSLLFRDISARESAAFPADGLFARKRARLSPTPPTGNPINSGFHAPAANRTRLRVDKCEGGIAEKIGGACEEH